jgi:hypothetical protein
VLTGSGAKLIARKGEPAGTSVLVDGTLESSPVTDMMDPDVSRDGSTIVFSGFSRADGAFRIFQVDADGTDLRQVTASNRAISLERYGANVARLETYDDLDPCYLPDGRICFSSTRYPGIVPDSRMRSTNLYVVGADGSGLHRITSERFGGDNPTVNPSTGRITYSRWWRSADAAEGPPVPAGTPLYYRGPDPSQVGVVGPVLRGMTDAEFPGLNSWFAAHVNPDGTGLAMESGFRLDRELTQAWKPSYMPDGSLLALFIPAAPVLGVPGANGLRRFQAGPGEPTFLGGVQSFRGPGGRPVPPLMPSFFYSSAAALASGELLVTGSFQGDPANLDKGVYLQTDGSTPPVLLVDFPGLADVDAVPLVPWGSPPIVPDATTQVLLDDVPRDLSEAIREGGSFTFRVENIFFNAPVDTPMPSAPPIGRNLQIQFFMEPRVGPPAGDAPTLLQTESIGPEGKIEVELPAGVPLFEVLRRQDGTIPVGRDGQVFHVGGMNFNRAGQRATCVGCHAGHSMIAVPEDPSWTNLAPSATVRASSTRQDSGTSFQPQAVVDRRTDGPVFSWSADPRYDFGAISWVELSWPLPLSARSVVIHKARHGSGEPPPREQSIEELRIELFLHGEPIQSDPILVSGPLADGGSVVPLDPRTSFDALRVSIDHRKVSGDYEGGAGVALGDIEVIAKVSSLQAETTALFIRGDANCDGLLNLSDPITTLNMLFLSGPGPCCGAAADSNSDLVIDLTDPIVSLSYLFRGAAPLAPPFPECGRAALGPFMCDTETCRPAN